MTGSAYQLFPYIALLDGLLGYCVILLSGVFDGNSSELLFCTAVVMTHVISSWLCRLSLPEIKDTQLRQSPETDSQAAVPLASAIGAGQSKDSAPCGVPPMTRILDTPGFDELSAVSWKYGIEDITDWLHECSKSSAHAFALNTDGAVFADAREIDSSNIWILGDVHGDIKALRAAFSLADKWSRENSAGDPTIISLGDLIDRGDDSMETLLYFLGEARRRHGKVGWICGNHENGFGYDKATGRFYSRTSPQEFTEWLNAHQSDGNAVAFGREVAALCPKLPDAALLQGGLLLVHGGVPHRDLHERLHAMSDLEDSDMRHDFIWTRLHESLRRKRPSRSSNCQLGVLDVLDFLAILESIAGDRVTMLLRGHDHFAERVKTYEAYYPGCQVATINTCSTPKDGAYTEHALEFTPPAVARYGNGELEIFRITR